MPPTQFKFLAVEQPNQAPDAGFRKQVRSHVTKLQHRRSRLQSHDQRCKREIAATQPQWTNRTEDRGRSPIVDGQLASTLATGPLAMSYSTGARAFHTFTLDDPSNIVDRILSNIQLDVSSVLHYYKAMLVTQTPEFERQYASIASPGSAVANLYPEIFTEPALMGAAMVLSLGHMTSSRAEPLTRKVMYHILQLRGHVITSINKALAKSLHGSVSDRLIVAVLLLATFEALHGFREAYPTHMKGLMDMVNSKGGLSALGMGGSTEAFILWQDSNLSHITGSGGFSPLANNPSRLPTARPDREHFLMGSRAEPFPEDLLSDVLEDDEIGNV